MGFFPDNYTYTGPQFLPFRLSSRSIHPPRINQAPQFPGYGPGELGVSHMNYTINKFDMDVGFHDCDIEKYCVSKERDGWKVHFVISKDNRKYEFKFGHIEYIMTVGLGNIINEWQLDSFTVKDPHPEMFADLGIVNNGQIYQYVFSSNSSGFLISNFCEVCECG